MWFAQGSEILSEIGSGTSSGARDEVEGGEAWDESNGRESGNWCSWVDKQATHIFF